MNVGPAFHDDDRVAVGDAGPCREPFVLRDVLDPDCLANLLDQVRAPGALALEVGEQVRRPVDDFPALGRAHVLQSRHLEVRPTRPDSVDGFERGREDGGLDLVEPAGDGHLAVRTAALRLDRHVDPTDLRGLL